MDKYQEALNTINQSDEEKFIEDCRNYFNKYKVSPVVIIQELINKEKPMKVNKIINKERVYFSDVSYVYSDLALGKCPNCETYLHEENEYGDIIDYCPYWGQRLDWSDGE